MKRFFLITISCVLASLSAFGQGNFLLRQDEIFSSSEHQFLIRELRAMNKDYFDCDKGTTTKIPDSGQISLFGYSLTISEKEKENFSKLFFPSQSCERYRTLISLCDLYLPLFRKECQSASLPDDFRFLPVLLSGCNQQMTTPDGKAGLWAMDYLIARRQHLRVDTIIDERKGGDFTTHAAVEYLSELYIRYDSDPFKTIVAYIKGVPYTESWPEDLHGAQIIDHIDAETAAFIKALACFIEMTKTTRLTNQLNNYFDILGQYEALQPSFPIQVAALRNVLGADPAGLSGMNPVYCGQFIPVGYRKVPFVMDRVLTLKFEAYSDSIYNWKPAVVKPVIEAEESEKVIYYTVRKGDSLGKIAAKYHVSIKQIKKWNNLKSDRISKGKKLKIIVPGSKPKSTAQHSTPSENNTKPKVDSTNQPAEHHAASENGVKENYSKPVKPKQVTYVVKSGDSLWKIAKKYPGVSEKDIMKWNKCGTDIRPGQKLVIYPNKSK